MLTRTNLTLMLAALLFGLYISWRFTQPELVGHWHVSQTMGTADNGMKGIYHFNIYANGGILVNEVNDGDYVLPGFIEKLSRRIHFGGECWYVGADYRIWGNRLVLTEEGRDGVTWRAIAHRAKVGDCDPEMDYFAGMPISIQLPVATSDQLEPLPEDLHNTHSFYLGEERGGRVVRLLAHRYRDILTLEDMQELLERSAKWAKLLEKQPSQIILFQDADVEAKEQLAFLKTAFVEAGFNGYYRVYRSLDGAEQLNLGSQWIEF